MQKFCGMVTVNFRAPTEGRPGVFSSPGALFWEGQFSVPVKSCPGLEPERTFQKRCPFHYRGLECKSRKSKTPGVTGKFGLGIRNEAGQRLIEFCQENALVIAPSSNNTRGDSTHGHHRMVNTKIRLIILFAAKDGEALYSQQKQDRELTVAQIMNSLLPNSDLN